MRNMNRFIGILFLSTTLCIPAEAKKVVLEDFENYQLGQELSMVNRWGQNHNSRCVVEKDPANANNKVLHIYLNDWNTSPVAWWRRIPPMPTTKCSTSI